VDLRVNAVRVSLVMQPLLRRITNDSVLIASAETFADSRHYSSCYVRCGATSEARLQQTLPSFSDSVIANVLLILTLNEF